MNDRHQQPDEDPDRVQAANRFLDETAEFWEPRIGRPLTREDARQIIENLTGFFRVLEEWQVEEERTHAQDRPAPDRRAA